MGMALGRTERVLQGKWVWSWRGMVRGCVRNEDVLSEGLLDVLLASDGLGYCFCLDIPESVSSKLDRLFPFTLLKRVPGLRYIPGASAERRASESVK